VFGLRLKLYLLAALSFVAGLLGIYASGVHRGKSSERNRRNEERLDAMKEAKNVEDNVRSLDDDALADRASKWVRDQR
jgi:hypothetical protein